MLLVLGLFWGASFLFVRVAVPHLGASWLVEWRVLLGALLLAVIARTLRQPVQLRLHARRYLFLGFFNVALPFLLFAWAAHNLTAALLSVINATAPLWGAVIARVWGGVALTGRRLVGLLLGFAGVLVLMGFDPVMLRSDAWLAAGAALLAPVCYGIAGQYVNQTAKSTAKPPPPLANAEGSLWGALPWLTPLVFFAPFTPLPPASEPLVWLAVAGMGLLSTGLAYLIFYRLIALYGVASSLTVAFLTPVFGIVLGHVFLGEVVGWHTLGGTLTVLLGTALVTGFNPLAFFQRKEAARA